MKLLAICLLVCYFNFINASCIGNVLGWGVKCQHNQSLNLNVSEIKVYFYNFQKNTELMFSINEATNGILSIPNLNRKMKFFLYVPGFKSHINSSSVLKIKKTLSQLPNCYLIIIDHSAYTHSNGLCKLLGDYDRSVGYVYYIGQRLAVMLEGLSKGMISPKNMHCIGHSLGGQTCGHVGENFFKITGQRIARITALDPAGPCFQDHPRAVQVRSGVADYVEVYHCNTDAFGSSSTIADVDFFVNSGESQSQCKKIFKYFSKDKCSHRMCVSMWAASIKRDQAVIKQDMFLAYRCENYEMFKGGKCSNNNKTIAGFWNPGYAKGRYYFSTKSVQF